MALLGIPYQVLAAPVPEDAAPGEAPETAARRIATAKAEAAATRLDAGLVVGADTIVVLDGAVLGKPATRREAATMLRSLRARAHQVITAVAVLDVASGQQTVTATTTQVLMRDYSDAEISSYVASGEPMDKAGAYGIQSESFHPASAIDGCYLNVVGLPLCALASSLHDFGVCSLAVPPKMTPANCPVCPKTPKGRLDTV